MPNTENNNVTKSDLEALEKTLTHKTEKAMLSLKSEMASFKSWVTTTIFAGLILTNGIILVTTGGIGWYLTSVLSTMNTNQNIRIDDANNQLNTRFDDLRSGFVPNGFNNEDRKKGQEDAPGVKGTNSSLNGRSKGLIDDTEVRSARVDQ